jgi:PII-like signaling protein
MALNYRVIEVYSSEEIRHRGKPLYDALVAHVKGLRIAARCLVTRGIAGCYESGEVASRNILTISYNLPVKVEIVLPAAETDRRIAGHRGHGDRGDRLRAGDDGAQLPHAQASHPAPDQGARHHDA